MYLKSNLTYDFSKTKLMFSICFYAIERLYFYLLCGDFFFRKLNLTDFFLNLLFPFIFTLKYYLSVGVWFLLISHSEVFAFNFLSVKKKVLLFSTTFQLIYTSAFLRCTVFYSSIIRIRLECFLLYLIKNTKQKC